jgi:hypothetical protein
MSFIVAAALKKSSARAKSDVANKLVSMFLHEVSRKACAAGGMNVSDPRYAATVVAAFGCKCLYCRKELEESAVPVVEHLNGMNRISLGLHVPGNVSMACKACNNKKRDDDQKLPLAENGWESFLSHDGSRCRAECRTCAYWINLFPNQAERRTALCDAKNRVFDFQAPYQHFVNWSLTTRSIIRAKIELLYRDCQRFATAEIDKLTSEVDLQFNTLNQPASPLEAQRLSTSASADFDAGEV